MINYAITIYGHAPNYILNRLQITQNTLIRALFKKLSNEGTHELYKKYKIKTVKQLFVYRLLLKYRFAEYPRQIAHNLNTRNQRLQYILPGETNNFGTRLNVYCIPNLRNMMPHTDENLMEICYRDFKKVIELFCKQVEQIES